MFYKKHTHMLSQTHCLKFKCCVSAYAVITILSENSYDVQLLEYAQEPIPMDVTLTEPSKYGLQMAALLTLCPPHELVQ